MLDAPIDFSDARLDELLNYNLTKEEFRFYTNRLFNIETGIVSNRSGAMKGIMGKLNRRDIRIRENIYHKRLKRIGKAPEGWTKVLAEGDSWFEYPIYVRDIISHLIRREKKFAIRSIGAGGDWMSNMIFEREYLFHLSTLRPHVFLVSGGGNDIMGEQLGALVDASPDLISSKDKTSAQKLADETTYMENYRIWVKHRLTAKDTTQRILHVNFAQKPIPQNIKDDMSRVPAGAYDNVLLEKIIKGRKYLNPNFYGFLKLLKFQYRYMHKTIESEDPIFYDSLLIITQGYDYPLPSYSRKLPIFRWILNTYMHNGRWLKAPLTAKGITDPFDQECAMAAMIFEYNEMMIDLTTQYKNMCHIDSRGIVQSLFPKNPRRGWFDEPHVKSCVFKRIAKQYAQCIRQHSEILKSKTVNSAYRLGNDPTIRNAPNTYHATVFKCVEMK
ncbi:MAG: hypothetical protein WCR52_21005 [Bacteroidota bacterium]